MMINTILYILGSLLIVVSVFLAHGMAYTLLMTGILVMFYILLRAIWII